MHSKKMSLKPLKDMRESKSKLEFNLDQDANMTQSKMLLQSIILIKSLLNINRAKSGSLISGLLGAHLAKDQWHTIKKCSPKEELTGVTRLRSLVSVLIKLQKWSCRTSKPRVGKK